MARLSSQAGLYWGVVAAVNNDTASLSVVSTIRTGAGARGVAVSDQGYANTTSGIRSRSNSVIAALEVGGARTG